MQEHKRSVLVTGGAGFIGSHVARELCQKGYQVVVIDDLSGGFRENVPAEAEFVEGSINDVVLLADLFLKYRFDYVFHFAAYAAEGLSSFIKRFNYTNNVIGSVNLINESIKNDVKCFVFASSAAVYGSHDAPAKEDMLPQPEDSYGVAKYTVEMELKISHKMFGLNYVIFRFHNVYGEYQNINDKYRNVIGIFMHNILQDKPLAIFGDGEQTRAFTHIDDIVPLIVKSVQTPRCYGEIFNAGADKPYTVNYLAQTVMKVMEREVAIVHLPKRDEVKHVVADHAKLWHFLGKHNNIDLEEGVGRMAQWVNQVGIRKSKTFKEIEIYKNMPPSWIDSS